MINNTAKKGFFLNFLKRRAERLQKGKQSVSLDMKDILDERKVTLTWKDIATDYWNFRNAYFYKKMNVVQEKQVFKYKKSDFDVSKGLEYLKEGLSKPAVYSFTKITKYLVFLIVFSVAIRVFFLYHKHKNTKRNPIITGEHETKSNSYKTKII